MAPALSSVAVLPVGDAAAWPVTVNVWVSGVAPRQYSVYVPPSRVTVKLLAGSPGAGASFQGLMVPDSPAAAAQIATYLNYTHATKIRLFGPSLWDHPDLIKIGSRAVENAVFVSGFYRQSVNSNVTEFNDRYYYAYNENPSQWDATGYDAAMILQKLMVGQRRNRATLRDGLLSLEYPGLTGSVSFRSDGTAKRTIYTLTVQGGRIVEISPSPAVTTPAE